MMKKTLTSAALAASLFALSAPASAYLTNWYVDTDGAGGNAPVFVADYLDLVGQAFVSNTFTGATTFNFNEVGRFTTSTADGGSVLGGVDLLPVLTSRFVGTGSGTTGGALTFAPGSMLEVYSGATNIASFSLLTGSANLLANSTLPNGTISLIFKAMSMSTDYFFDGFMNDLAPSVPNGLTFGFATTNAIPLNQNVASVLVSDYNAAFDPDIAGPVTPNGSTLLYISNNGQYRLAVPEPSMLSLLGLALVGLGFSTRRKSTKS